MDNDISFSDISESLVNATVYDGSIVFMEETCETFSRQDLMTLFEHLREIRGFLQVTYRETPFVFMIHEPTYTDDMCRDRFEAMKLYLLFNAMHILYVNHETGGGVISVLFVISI